MEKWKIITNDKFLLLQKLMIENPKWTIKQLSFASGISHYSISKLKHDHPLFFGLTRKYGDRV